MGAPMNDLRRFRLVDLVLFLAVLLTAGGVRVWYLSSLAGGGTTDGPLHVQDARPALPLPPDSPLHGRSDPTELDALVHNLTEHRWYGSAAPFAHAEEKTAHAAPGYPWLLSWLEQARMQPVDRTVRWLQAVLGALTAGFYFLFARQAFQSRLVAALAGLLCALHPFW